MFFVLEIYYFIFSIQISLAPSYGIPERSLPPPVGSMLRMKAMGAPARSDSLTGPKLPNGLAEN